jgi:nitrogen fixation protein NifQ
MDLGANCSDLEQNAAALHAPADANFTTQVFTSLLEIGLADAGVSGAAAALGLTGPELIEIAARFAPTLLPRLSEATDLGRVVFDEEVEQLRELFLRHRADDSRETAWFVSILARRCMSPNHLWQDLGLPSRDHLNRLMRERFPTLAARNAQNMKWKKFFYRCLCELEGFTLCAAPSCAECADYCECFGPEEGLSRIAPFPTLVSTRHTF